MQKKEKLDKAKHDFKRNSFFAFVRVNRLREKRREEKEKKKKERKKKREGKAKVWKLLDR